MSLVYEDEKTKEVYVVLVNNDYVKVMTYDKKNILKIKNENGKLIAESVEVKTDKKSEVS